VSWQAASQQVAVMFAAVLGLGLTSRLTGDQMMRWGWRVPLLVGYAIIPLLFLCGSRLRRLRNFFSASGTRRRAKFCAH
jgi:MFS family permease